MGKKGDLKDLKRGMAVGARLAGLSSSETADLLGFSCTTIFRVYRECSEKERISSERQFSIMSIWSKISEECFQHLVESMPRRIKAVLKAKGCPTWY